MKTTLQSLLVLLSFGSLPFTVLSQQMRLDCGSDRKMKEMMIRQPGLSLIAEAPGQSPQSPQRDLKIIPVVFHILHEYGTENINDSQVLDAMQILNADFSMQNEDLEDIIPEFQDITGNPQIEFRLATLDPDGNCTNGIEHVYSHETNVADNWSMINQWPRDKYLNIWVVKTIGSGGTAGYSYYPAAVTGEYSIYDGVVMLNDYIGSIGTGSVFRARSLTHEVSHWLGLPHVNASGILGETCGDDGIADTPVTKGHWSCNLNSDECTPGTLENVQNFMEFSYCGAMFTEGQAAFLQAALESDVAERNNLWTEQNLAATGTLDPQGICTPVADFYATYQMIGTGSPTTFHDVSWNGPVTAWEWLFPGGTPSVATVPDPSVIYTEEGSYDVQLIVSNGSGTDTLLLEDYIYVSPEWAGFYGPVSETFETGTANWWIVQNPEDHNGGFTLTPGTGTDGSAGMALMNHFDASHKSITDEEYYYNRLGNTKDALVSPSMYLANTGSITVSFDYAYASLSGESDHTAKLVLYASRDAGKTWTIRSTTEGADLLTVSTPVAESFVPQAGDWRNAVVNYTAVATDTRTRFRLLFTAADSSNNLYIDNFNVSGVLGIDEAGASGSFSIYPNPVKAGEAITILASEAQDLEVSIRNVSGSLISMEKIENLPGGGSTQISAPVTAGCYFVTIAQGGTMHTKKVIVQ